MIDCEKCKYYHDNCDAKFRCRIDVEKIRADAIDECIKTLAKSEDTILSDRQYYTLMELKEQQNNE